MLLVCGSVAPSTPGARVSADRSPVQAGLVVWAGAGRTTVIFLGLSP